MGTGLARIPGQGNPGTRRTRVSDRDGEVQAEGNLRQLEQAVRHACGQRGRRGRGRGLSRRDAALLRLPTAGAPRCTRRRGTVHADLGLNAECERICRGSADHPQGSTGRAWAEGAAEEANSLECVPYIDSLTLILPEGHTIQAGTTMYIPGNGGPALDKYAYMLKYGIDPSIAEYKSGLPIKKLGNQ